MEILMRKLILTSVAAMALATVPALAQDKTSSPNTSTSAQPADQTAPPVQSAGEGKNCSGRMLAMLSAERESMIRRSD